MRCVSYCAECGSSDIDLITNEDGKWSDDYCHCNKCNKTTAMREKYIESPYERTRNYVYSTGNRWAIENFTATH